MRMAADSDGSLTAVVICEGNLHDPEFPRKFRHLLAKLKFILQQPKKSKKLKVNKVEPWNSVRVTLSIPKDAAVKLRQLASEGSSALRALGILSVQLEGDTVISLRLVGHDLVLRTDNTTTGCVQEAGSSNTTTTLGDLSQILGGRLQQTTSGPPPSSATQIIPSPPQSSLSEPIAGPSHRIVMPPTPILPLAAGALGGSNDGPIVNPVAVNGPTSEFDKTPIFKSPNTVCPMDGKLPVPPLANIAETREYPFESMTQARVIQRRENTMAVVAALGGGGQSIIPASNTPIGGIGQGAQVTPPPPPPLTIPLAASPVDPATQATSQVVMKSPFMQPPPPPYPSNPGVSHMKSIAHGAQHTVQKQQSNSIVLTNNTNALSSPLLVNLLQNDGVGQVKVPSAGSSAIMQPQTQLTSSSPAAVSNLPGQTQNDGVLHLNSNNNSNDSSSNISISPSIPVPSSSQPISNVSNNTVAGTTVATPTGSTVEILNQNLLGASQQSAGLARVGIRVQQQRFSAPLASQQQQQNILPHHQIIQNNPMGLQIQRFPSQQSPQVGGVGGSVAGVSQPSFRHPQQQVAMQQPYTTSTLTPHPSLVNHPQQQTAQILTNNFNHPRWPFKPMDSATKSSFQEFARYQLQYNLQQEMNNQTTLTVAGLASSSASTSNRCLIDGAASLNSSISTAVEKSGVTDALGLSSYLDELSKTDLDSLLLPGLSDLDTALDLDGKNALESLLDAKDLDLDLIDQEDSPSSLPVPIVTGSASTLDNLQMQQSTSVAAPLAQSTVVTQQLHPQSQLQSSEKPKNNLVSCTDSSSNTNLNKEQANKTSTGKERQYLINPLTGELEPMPSEDESESEELVTDNIDVFNAFNSEVSNSLYSDDENSCSTAFSKASDHSDTERSSNSEASGRSRYSKSKKERKDGSGAIASYSNKKSKSSIKNTLLREKLQQGLKEKISGKSKQPKEKVLTKAKLISIDDKDSEKIKLRLKLEKSEPISPAYKVDISFVPSPKRCQGTVNSVGTSSVNYTSFTQSSISLMSTASNASPIGSQQYQSAVQTSTVQNSSNSSLQTEEPRVPPLHISLRGKNSIIIKNSKKDRKKSQSGGEEDEIFLKKSQSKRNIAVDDQTAANRYAATNDHGTLSNSMSSKVSGQGKPISRPPQYEEYPVSNSYSKAGLENGDDNEKVVVTSKRMAADLVNNPNGIISPENKKRRMSQSQEQHQILTSHGDKHAVEPYNHLHGPIGSTNVGTMPTHSSLSKNQKSANNNNSTNFISKLHKNALKSGKPLVVVKHCKSASNNPVKDPGKSPPLTAKLENSQAKLTATPVKTTVATSSSSSPILSPKSQNSGSCIAPTASKSLPDSQIVKSVSVHRPINKQINSICLMPQSSTDAISKEKFKQKLLEYQNANEDNVEKTTFNTKGSNTVSNINKSSEQSVSSDESKSHEISNDQPVLYPTEQQSGDANKTITVCSSNNNVGIVDAIEDRCSESNVSSKEDGRIKEQQLRAPNQSQNSSAIDVGVNLLSSGNTNSNVRSSPGSHAQGEDSGIESMDALSEKSPHQSASPQQGDTQPAHMARKIDVDIGHCKLESQVQLVIKEEQEEEITNMRDIEAALAKMEGINEQFLTPCESPMHKMNGDHSMKEESLLENLTDEKIMLCATKLEQEEDLAVIMGGSSSGKSSPIPVEGHDLNENKEISAEMSLETQLVDECCKKSLKPNIKMENDADKSTRLSSPSTEVEKNFDENVIHLSSSPKEVTMTPGAEILSMEVPVMKDKVNTDPKSYPTALSSSPLSSDVISDSNDKCVVDIKEILKPISIEIPTQSESEIPRVRTRASSKLESPLDAPKQSPQLDSPATVNSLKPNLRLSSAAIDRLSPKVNAGKCGGNVVGVVAGNKRKRQGSESSTHSGISDDTPSRNTSVGCSNAKRTRPNSISSTTPHGSCENLNMISKTNSSAGGSKKIGNNKMKKGPDESSDSDEPLIEVAGKVRGSKGHSGRTYVVDGNNDSKILRNHRVSSQNSRTTPHSMQSTIPSMVIHNQTLQNQAASKSIRGACTSAPNTGTSMHSGTTVSASNNIGIQQNNTHCTRASSVSGTGVGPQITTVFVGTINASGSMNTQNINHASIVGHHHTPHDDKIGTRRSVRASAAANKIIYSRSGGPSSGGTNSESTKSSASASVKSTTSLAGGEITEPRRKTRSAAGGEVVESRRRRGSRDSK